MSRLPDESINFQNTVGDSGVENLYVYGKLNCNSVNDVQISVNGSTLTFTVAGVGSTTLTLS
tara:strand:+ start:545 stop:730 length:186 start_codon:yes stop_codon:yes gene_type:complete